MIVIFFELSFFFIFVCRTIILSLCKSFLIVKIFFKLVIYKSFKTSLNAESMS